MVVMVVRVCVYLAFCNSRQSRSSQDEDAYGMFKQAEGLSHEYGYLFNAALALVLTKGRETLIGAGHGTGIICILHLIPNGLALTIK